MSLKRLDAFRKNNAGGVVVTFALTATMLLSVAGGAVDFAKAYSARTKLQKAADMGALAGANDPSQPEKQAREVASMFFESARTPLVQDIKPDYAVTRDATGTTFSVTVSATANVETSLLRVIGVRTLPVSVLARASRPLNTLDIYVAVDMSASMGLAADDANRAKLIDLMKPYSIDGKGCSFACHFKSTWWDPPVANTYDFARLNNIKLREDVMKEAFSSFVDEFLNPNDLEVKNSMRRIATYGFSDALTPLQLPTADAAVVKDSLKKFPDSLRFSTIFEVIMPALTTAVGVSGAGTLTDRKKMVLLVTDGVRWDSKIDIGGPFDAALCSKLKSNGVDIAVLEVKYFEDTSEYYFNLQVKPFYAGIMPALKACASPGFYFRVDDSADSQLRNAFAEVARAMKPKLVLVQ